MTLLQRMYLRWAERRGYQTEILDETPVTSPAWKSVTIRFVGNLASTAISKAERGVHRLVRISPFDANKRRHTSFARGRHSRDMLEEGGSGDQP